MFENDLVTWIVSGITLLNLILFGVNFYIMDRLADGILKLEEKLKEIESHVKDTR